MKKLVLLLTLLIITPVFGGDFNVNFGITPMFGGMSVSLPCADNLGFNKSQTFTEAYALFVNRQFGVRGFYMFPKTATGNTEILDPHPAKDAKVTMIPIVSDLTFSTTRLELGVPNVVSSLVLEPFMVYLNTTGSLKVTGPNCGIQQDLGNSYWGVGISVTENISRGFLINGRGFYAGNNSQIAIKALSYNNNIFCGVGWADQRYHIGDVKIKVSGPILEVGMMF